MNQDTVIRRSSFSNRIKTACRHCGGEGAVVYIQQTSDGRPVEVAYRCACAAGAHNFPSLAPDRGQPTAVYLSEEEQAG
jgi:hypothetical protein